MKTQAAIEKRIESLTVALETQLEHMRALDAQGLSSNDGAWRSANTIAHQHRDTISALEWVLEAKGANPSPDHYQMALSHINDLPNNSKAIVYAILALCDRLEQR